jgi:hypothetical protein
MGVVPTNPNRRLQNVGKKEIFPVLPLGGPEGFNCTIPPRNAMLASHECTTTATEGFLPV